MRPIWKTFGKLLMFSIKLLPEANKLERISMCYDVAYRRWKIHSESTEKLSMANYQLWLDNDRQIFHTSGFSHPDLPMIVEDNGHLGRADANWGLVPIWVKKQIDAVKIKRQTLNARSETMFEKPSFRSAAKARRCIVVVDGFFEHKHVGKKTQPYFIRNVYNKPLLIAGLYESQNNFSPTATVSLVTTVANEMMAVIHNNPELEGPRMPVFLSEEKVYTWLAVESSKDELLNLCVALGEEELKAVPVAAVRGKHSSGNKLQAWEEVEMLT